ncbi:MAG: hypothetical protein HRU09_14615 [Oligoflexales bacterium]|nr:hypothetical protein [Oligoflexales bacterium]
MRFFILIALLTSCVTPMSENEVVKLTTCQNTSIKKIRRNLLLNDFEIKSMTRDDLQTDYKQIGGYRSRQKFQRITVVRTEGKNFRFSVRYKTLTLDKVDTGSTEIKSGRNFVKTKQSQVIQNNREQNESYFVDYRDHYKSIQRKICRR